MNPWVCDQYLKNQALTFSRMVNAQRRLLTSQIPGYSGAHEFMKS